MPMETTTISVDPEKILLSGLDTHSRTGTWQLAIPESSLEHEHLSRAARELCNSNVPVAFPTETVYGLGADATRSDAVRGIFAAKQRPSDNPLIVHVHSLAQLRQLLNGSRYDDTLSNSQLDVPAIYMPLIERFWPGPLSLIMPLGPDTCLAPEVTAGLETFGARMPRSPVALALMKMAGVPIAAPSANASSKPSPTTAEHVRHDLNGRIATIIDAGPCDVGIESTVVDGLCDPPMVLRPGNISAEQLRSCPGWENVKIGYQNDSGKESKPRAPGMKYKHYSPKASVVLYEAGSAPPERDLLMKLLGEGQKIGIVRTTTWRQGLGLEVVDSGEQTIPLCTDDRPSKQDCGYVAHRLSVRVHPQTEPVQLWELALGGEPARVAHGLFAALREFDLINVELIIVEGIDESQGHIAAAIMNRLRKAAEVHL